MADEPLVGRPLPLTAEQERLHRRYLRRVYDQHFRVNSPLLARQAGGQSSPVNLPDIYVPLPVDCKLSLQLEEQRIVDWSIGRGARVATEQMRLERGRELPEQLAEAKALQAWAEMQLGKDGPGAAA